MSRTLISIMSARLNGIKSDSFVWDAIFPVMTSAQVALFPDSPSPLWSFHSPFWKKMRLVLSLFLSLWLNKPYAPATFLRYLSLSLYVPLFQVFQHSPHRFSPARFMKNVALKLYTSTVSSPRVELSIFSNQLLTAHICSPPDISIFWII